MYRRILALVSIVYLGFAGYVLFSQDKLATIISSLMVCLAVAIGFIAVVFFIGQRLHRYDVIDAAWGPIFIVIALTSYILGGNDLAHISPANVVTLLVFIWGSRLSLHIIRRIKHTDHEDPRYLELRKDWKGNVALNMFLRVYILQAVLALVVSIPVIHLNLFTDTHWSIVAYAGIVLWVVGFCFEVVGDSQLRSFVADSKNKGKVMQAGLWKYSRHPNYFGEVTQWWAIFLVSLSIPYGWIGIIGPMMITFLILFVSGIPLNEARFEGRPGWKEYKKRTSVFFPLPPKS